MITLDPPYPGPGRPAAWHEHFSSGPDEDPRFDAVEDDLGRIFVWDSINQSVVTLCPDRATARLIARMLAAPEH